MELVFILLPALAGFLGLWQCFRGWQTGKMFAFDPGGSATGLSRRDGVVFVFGWWITLIVSLAALAFAFAATLQQVGEGEACEANCSEAET
ncbi:hypothetical protein CD351_08745 [Erythrobacter sp. KY5]|nr:hypothetical protein CD351_08745 [Erythrobacter sp. KY5]